MNIDIDAFALLINDRGGNLTNLYQKSGYFNGLKLPERNKYGKVKLSDALFFKQMLDTMRSPPKKLENRYRKNYKTVDSFSSPL
ncbi:hypothetical protein ABN075_19360 [Providencia rettgeri]